MRRAKPDVIIYRCVFLGAGYRQERFRVPVFKVVKVLKEK